MPLIVVKELALTFLPTMPVSQPFPCKSQSRVEQCPHSNSTVYLKGFGGENRNYARSGLKDPVCGSLCMKTSWGCAMVAVSPRIKEHWKTLLLFIFQGYH